MARIWLVHQNSEMSPRKRSMYIRSFSLFGAGSGDETTNYQSVLSTWPHLLNLSMAKTSRAVTSRGLNSLVISPTACMKARNNLVPTWWWLWQCHVIMQLTTSTSVPCHLFSVQSVQEARVCTYSRCHEYPFWKSYFG